MRVKVQKLRDSWLIKMFLSDWSTEILDTLKDIMRSGLRKILWYAGIIYFFGSILFSSPFSAIRCIVIGQNMVATVETKETIVHHTTEGTYFENRLRVKELDFGVSSAFLGGDVVGDKIKVRVSKKDKLAIQYHTKLFMWVELLINAHETSVITSLFLLGAFLIIILAGVMIFFFRVPYNTWFVLKSAWSRQNDSFNSSKPIINTAINSLTALKRSLNAFGIVTLVLILSLILLKGVYSIEEDLKNSGFIVFPIFVLVFFCTGELIGFIYRFKISTNPIVRLFSSLFQIFIAVIGILKLSKFLSQDFTDFESLKELFASLFSLIL